MMIKRPGHLKELNRHISPFHPQNCVEMILLPKTLSLSLRHKILILFVALQLFIFKKYVVGAPAKTVSAQRP